MNDVQVIPAPVELTLISDIKVGERGRQEIGEVTELAESILRAGNGNPVQGLLHPIVIDKDKKLIAGFRRLTAFMILKQTHIPTRNWGDLSELERKQIELEENIKRKQLTWQEEVAMTEELHRLMQIKTPEPESKLVRGPGQPEKAWSLEDTATLLGTSIAKVSQDISLANAIKDMPELKQQASKTNARRLMRKTVYLAALVEQQVRAALKGTAPESKIIHGDCCKELQNFADSSVDLVITDPPWGINIDSAAREWMRMHTTFDDTQKKAIEDTQRALTECYRILKDGSHLYLFSAWEFMHRWQEYLTELGFWVRPSPLVWVKGNVTAGQPYWMFMDKTECIIFAHKGQGGRPLVTPASDVLLYDSPRQRIHPTQKPVDLLRFLIGLSTVNGELVVDPFSGSGETVRAAMLMGRRGIGIEEQEETFNLSSAYIITPEKQSA